MARRRVTSREVAKAAGVSLTTVSYVLNGVTEMRISEETRQRVLETARRLNYHPSAAARSLVRQQTHILGLVLRQHPDRLGSNAFLPPVIHGITSVIAPAGFKLLVESVEDVSRPDAYLSLIHEAHVDGIILGARADDQQLLRLHADNFPVVLWGRLPEIDLPFVDVNNVKAARLAVDHLIGLGHQRIACITNAPPHHTANEAIDRLAGYRAALEAHGLPYDETLIRYGAWEVHSGFEAMRSLLELPHRPSAVFVASDEVAMGALRAARSAGVRIPHDLALMGFDDILVSAYMTPSITTVRVPAYELGAAAARMLIEIIQTGQRPAPVLLETQLIVRESCGAQSQPLVD